MRIRIVATCATALLPVAFVGATPPAFSDQTSAAGVTASHNTSGFVNLQYSGGGAVGDFNRDGFMDFFMMSGGGGNQPDFLFINNGNGTFTNKAAQWGMTVIHRGKSACVGDYDHDGWPDLYVTSAGIVGQSTGPGHHLLYHNNGNGTFTNVAVAAGVAFADPTAESAWSATFGDYNLDGNLDLFVGGFTGSASNSEQHLFKNNGNGTFTDVTASIGLFNGIGGIALQSARMADMDGDRYPELLLVGDFKGVSGYIGSRYFRNNGNGTFTDVTVASHTAQEENGMGQTILDFDNDGRIDWYPSSIYYPSSGWTGNKLYRNVSSHSFLQMAQAAGVDQGGYGWGTVGVDVNHDGWEDLPETGGDASTGSPFYAIPSRLYINNGNNTFTDQAVASGFIHSVKGRCLLRLDYDNDGDQDILIFRNNGQLTLFRNDLPAAADTHWIRIFLDTTGYPTLAAGGLGTRIVVKTPTGNRTRLIDGGVSFLGTSECSAHVGLGSLATVPEIDIFWNDGTTTVLTDVPANQTLVVTPANRTCGGDFDGDQAVTAADLGILLGAWGTDAGDVNGDGTTDAADLALLLGAWGGCA